MAPRPASNIGSGMPLASSPISSMCSEWKPWKASGFSALATRPTAKLWSGAALSSSLKWVRLQAS
jgi:hypothetical protein